MNSIIEKMKAERRRLDDPMTEDCDCMKAIVSAVISLAEVIEQKSFDSGYRPHGTDGMEYR